MVDAPSRTAYKGVSDVNQEQRQAYEWAKNQNYQSVAARYAKILAGMVDEITPPNEWVSVEERLPNFGKLVIATDGALYGIAWLCSDCTWMVNMGYKSQSWFGRKVTHWMPLPAPPAKE